MSEKSINSMDTSHPAVDGSVIYLIKITGQSPDRLRLAINHTTIVKNSIKYS